MSISWTGRHISSLETYALVPPPHPHSHFLGLNVCLTLGTHMSSFSWVVCLLFPFGASTTLQRAERHTTPSLRHLILEAFVAGQHLGAKEQREVNKDFLSLKTEFLHSGKTFCFHFLCTSQPLGRRYKSFALVFWWM